MTNKGTKTVITEPLIRSKEYPLLWDFLFSAIWMLIGHGFFLLKDAFSFDSLHVIGQADTSWKLSLGRFAQPLYKGFIRGNISSPWLMGILATLFLGLSMYFLAKTFHFQSRMSAFIVAGVLSVNLTIIITIAAYIHETDIFFLAFLLQVLAVYLWKSGKDKKSTLVYTALGTLCIAFSLGLYQAYLSVGVALVLLVCIQGCFNESVSEKQIWAKVPQAVAMVGIGCVLYYVFVQISMFGTTVTLSTDTNGLVNLFSYGDLSLLDVIINTYTQPINFLFFHTSRYSSTLVLLANWLLLVIILLGSYILTSKNKTKRLMVFILLFLFPFPLALINLLNPSAYYVLMTHAYCLYYVLALVVIKGLISLPKQNRAIRWTGITCLTLVLCVLWCSVRFANQVYLMKDLESTAFHSYMTEVFTRMDQVEGYVPGETPVLFLSAPDMPIIGYEFNGGFQEFEVLDTSSFYATKWRFQWYLQFIMQRSITLFSDGEAIERFRTLDNVQAMPTFPAPGCMQIIESVLVIKLSQNEW